MVFTLTRLNNSNITSLIQKQFELFFVGEGVGRGQCIQGRGHLVPVSVLAKTVVLLPQQLGVVATAVSVTVTI